MQIDDFIKSLPKLELHIHIEGTLTPSLRWRLAQKNNIPLPYTTFPDLQASYATMYNHRKEVNGDSGLPTFLEAYYGGMEVLRTESDFYDLAMEFFEKASSMNVRYLEPFFDIQAHTRRGVPLSAVMNGLLRAKQIALQNLDLVVNFTLCFLRDMPVSSALETFPQTLPWAHTLFTAIGLDSNEFNRPPNLFTPLFSLARASGLKITAHCDFGQANSHAHIQQCLTDLNLDRIDHGLDAASSPSLVAQIRSSGIGMTLCPHAYNRRNPRGHVMPLIRKLFDAGVKVTVNSDDPTYMHGMWVSENLQLVKDEGGFSGDEIVQLQSNAIEICWASEDVKGRLREELETFEKDWRVS